MTTSGVKEIAGTLYVEFKSMVEHGGDLEKVSEDSGESKSVGRAEQSRVSHHAG